MRNLVLAAAVTETAGQKVAKDAFYDGDSDSDSELYSVSPERSMVCFFFFFFFFFFFLEFFFVFC